MCYGAILFLRHRCVSVTNRAVGDVTAEHGSLPCPNVATTGCFARRIQSKAYAGDSPARDQLRLRVAQARTGPRQGDGSSVDAHCLANSAQAAGN